MADSIDLENEKKAIRKEYTQKRKTFYNTMPADTLNAIYDNIWMYFQHNSIDLQGKCVSGFLPIGSEIDVRPFLQYCRDNGAVTALPCVVKKDSPLVFRQWQDSDALITESFGTQAPADSATVVVPDIIISPLLAYNAECYRMGYGGGFYDRTIAEIQKNKRVHTIGVGFDVQLCEKLPLGKYDMALDCIATESKVFLKS